MNISFDIISDADIDQANWDSSKVRDKLQRDIDAHVAAVREAKLSELTSLYEVRFLPCYLYGFFVFLSLFLCMLCRGVLPNFEMIR